jgi:hypothetical protein
MPGIYQHLLRLYPVNHRDDFGEEMTGVFDELRADAIASGVLPQVRFYVRESVGLLVGAVHERWREFISRRLSMRTDFRFPKATWILMTIILAGVALAIEKGEAISASLSRVNPVAGPSYQPGQHALLSGIALSFLVIYGLGLLAWAAAFVFRRSEIGGLDGASSQK